MRMSDHVVVLVIASVAGACVGRAGNDAAGTNESTGVGTTSPSDDRSEDSETTPEIDMRCLEYIPGSDDYAPWPYDEEAVCAAEPTVEACEENSLCSPVLGIPMACHDGKPCTLADEPSFIGCVPQLVCNRFGIYCLLGQNGELDAYLSAPPGCTAPRAYGLCNATGLDPFEAPPPSCP